MSTTEKTRTAGAAVLNQLPAVQMGAPLAIRYNREQVDLLKRTVARGATDDEFALLLYQAERTGLDPLSKQIYLIKRWDSSLGRMVATIQTGIDGYRVIAQRTGQYAGNDEYEEGPLVTDTYTWTDKGNRPHEVIVTHPEWVRARVWRLVGGQRIAFSAKAYWAEYYPGPKQGAFWHRMPHNQPGKCAEALSLRKGFPAELSGLYTHEEMDQAGVEAITVDVVPEETPSRERIAEQLETRVFGPEEPEPQIAPDEPADAGAEQPDPDGTDARWRKIARDRERLPAKRAAQYEMAFGGVAPDDYLESRERWFGVLHIFGNVKRNFSPEKQAECWKRFEAINLEATGGVPFALYEALKEWYEANKPAKK